MARWHIRRPGWLAETAFFVALGGLAIAVWQSGVTAGVATRLLVDLSIRGFAGELVLAGTGIVALSFMAGAKTRGVAVGTIALLLIANSSMFGPSNTAGHYPTAPGGDEVSLVRIAAAESPEGSVPSRMITSLNIGELLGSATLLLPHDDELAVALDPILRAYTDIDTEFVEKATLLASGDYASERMRVAGTFDGVQVFVLGSSDRYLWIEANETSIIILAEGLLP